MRQPLSDMPQGAQRIAPTRRTRHQPGCTRRTPELPIPPPVIRLSAFPCLKGAACPEESQDRQRVQVALEFANLPESQYVMPSADSLRKSQARSATAGSSKGSQVGPAQAAIIRQDVLTFATHDEFRQHTVLADGTLFAIKGENVWMYRADQGAGVADDDQGVLKPNSVLLASPGRAYPHGAAAITETLYTGLTASASTVLRNRTLTVNSVANMRTALAAGVTAEVIVCRYHTTLGDGGGGTFNVVAIGSYVDDDRNVFAGGSLAAIRTSEPTITLAPSGTALHFYQGAWYSDAGHTTEAVDDAVRVRAAKDRLSAIGGGVLRLSAGNWYFKTFEPTASFREMVFPASNVTICGEGPATAIRIAPGLNTVAAGGYNVFALFHTSNESVIHNFHVRDLAIDFNSDFNQYPESWASVLAHQNSGVQVDKAINCSVARCQFSNGNGQKCVAFGLYGAVDDSDTVRVSDCVFDNMSDDPNVTNPITAGDQSYIAIGANNFHVTGNVISGSSYAKATATAIEVHGSNGTVQGNIVRSVLKLANVASDTNDSRQVLVDRNIGSDLAQGIALWLSTGYKLSGVTIRNNSLYLDKSQNASQIETGVITILSSDNLEGLEHCLIESNQIHYVGADAPAALSVGINITLNSSDMIIRGNSISGFGNGGIWYAGSAMDADTGNMVSDLTITENRIQNCDSFGIRLSTLDAETNAVFVRPMIVSNLIIDTQDVPTLVKGVHLYGKIKDAILDNTATGYTTYDVHIEGSPALGDSVLRYRNHEAATYQAYQSVVTSGPQVYGLRLTNDLTATEGSPTHGPSIQWHGQASNTSTHTVKDVLIALRCIQDDFSADPLPTIVFSKQVAGGAWGTMLQVTSYPTATVFSASNTSYMIGAGAGDSFGVRGTSVTKPAVVGSRGANAALASLIACLANQGLVSDSTTE